MVMGMGAVGIEIHDEAVRTSVPSATRRILPPISGVLETETGKAVVAFCMMDLGGRVDLSRLSVIVSATARFDNNDLVLLFIV